jgi:hypothetical protein
MTAPKVPLRVGVVLMLMLAVFVTPVSSVSAQENSVKCNKTISVFCDDFRGHTFFKNDGPNQDKAHWYKYAFNRDNAASYIDSNGNSEKYLRLQLDERASANNYSNANISTSEINNPTGNFPFGVNTRAEVRMRYSENMKANPFDSTQTARGSAGFLFWDYFTGSVNPEIKNLERVQDAFGFVWQDGEAVPTPGFWIVGVGGGMPGPYLPKFDIDLSQWHTYTIERRHDSMKFFIDGSLAQTMLLNQEGGLTLPDSTKLSTDMWIDNTTYVLDFSTFHINLDFNNLTQKQSIDIDSVNVTSLN